jgi:aminobenzoyl-glutamate transport protein
MLAFLVTGTAYGIGAGTVRTITDVIKMIEKSVTSLSGTIFLFFVLSQFVAYFTYTNMGTVMALSLSGTLRSANIGALPLLLGFIVVVALIDLLLTGAIAKWAIFAPVFVPLLMETGCRTRSGTSRIPRRGFTNECGHTAQLQYFALVIGFARNTTRALVSEQSCQSCCRMWSRSSYCGRHSSPYGMLGLPWGL